MGNTDQTKSKIILGFLKNDSGVLKQVYITVFPKVKIHILKNNGTETQAKDLFQEAFIACWKNIKANKLSENGNVEAYLYTIAKNKWTDFLRSPEFKSRMYSNENSYFKEANDEIENDYQQDEKNRNAMQLALQQLGENCKTLLNLFYFERKTMDQISAIMNLASASARNQKYRCMEKLRKLSLEIKKNG